MFSVADFQARLREQPFVPMRLVTSSGQSYDITHPDLVLVGRRILIIGTPCNDDPSIFETMTMVPVMHVTDVQDILTPLIVEAHRE
jgi:hypothetical protein